jgi:hypothetical protein
MSSVPADANPFATTLLSGAGPIGVSLELYGGTGQKLGCSLLPPNSVCKQGMLDTRLKIQNPTAGKANLDVSLCCHSA